LEVESALGGRLVCLYAPRRFGKTSLLDAAVEVLSQAHSIAALRVDLLGVVSLTDLAVRLEQAYGRALLGRARRVAQSIMTSTGLGLSLAGGGFGMTISRQPRTDPLPALHTLLDLPTRLGSRCYIVFDEFQSLMAVDGAEAILRSHIQRHRGHAAYAFAGSEPGLMERAFSDRSRPPSTRWPRLA
jgi:AAA+ ATPase superfamily predicted ATPase